MPPKAKYSKEEIINAAFDIVRNEGMSVLTARLLGAKLGTSSRPIFTAFQNMDEVQTEAIKAAKKLYASYVEKGLAEEKPFKGVGEQYIMFAVKEPKLFQLLFMSPQEGIPNVSDALLKVEDSFEKINASIQSSYGLGPATAEHLYHHLWIYTHGIATLCATGMCRFTGEEINIMISEVFVALLKNLKEGDAL